ncbi:MAG: 3-phosphoshikimate 1-carboxyvinyltransferase, partial [Rickettsiales bacterium]|nr:3-phosphoshikimate 1-carboxyvinyltransferase [Rickettsiales bacterium]
MLNINKIIKPINAILDIPSSKSLSVRALLLASFAEGKSIIKNVLDSDDTNNCIGALKSLGIKIEQNGKDFTIYGCGGKIEKSAEVFVGSSGITSRFLLALLVVAISHSKNVEIVIDGSEQLRKRPIKVLVDALRKIGANIEGESLPLKIKSAPLNGDCIEISGKESSQYVSAIYMMSPLLQKPVKIYPVDIDEENHPYIKMAIQTMKDFGIRFDNDLIRPQNYIGTEFIVEPDFNTANYFFSIAAATKGRVEINNLNKNTLQPGILFLNVLEKMGCKVEYKENSIAVIGDKLKGEFEINMFEMAEMVPTLAVLAVFADNPIKINGVSHIRHHESDRIR